MSYRDDREADRARIEALETELAIARRKVAELEERGAALVRISDGALERAGAPRTTGERWLGAAVRLELTRRFDGAFPVERLEELVHKIRELTGEAGRTELLRSSVTWSSAVSERSAGPFIVVTLTVRDGASVLTVTDRLGHLAGAMFGGLGGGLFGGTVVAPVLLAVHTVPMLAPFTVLGWLGAGFLTSRRLFRWRARRRAGRLQALFDALAADIAAALQPH